LLYGAENWKVGKKKNNAEIANRHKQVIKREKNTLARQN
jgi:hypothetical protein